jgi:uncharacterized protein (DUF433 family)
MVEYLSHITIDPEIRFGKPCIKGTRITVNDILNWLASGMTNEEILNDFPSIKEDDIRAALAFALPLHWFKGLSHCVGLKV